MSQEIPATMVCDGCISETGGRRVMRALNSYKVTILCGFITVLVLRGTLQQAGRGGPGFSELQVMENATWEGRRLSRKLMEVDEKRDDVMAGRFVEEESWDKIQPYSLGPKIIKWDEQRILWNERNPGKNKTRNGKPKTLLVSGSQPGPCANPRGDFYYLKFLKNRVDYARIHGIEFFYNMATFSKEMTSFWAKLPLLRNLMLNHPDVEWIWWMDSDAIFTDFTFEMPMDKYADKNLIIHGFGNLLFEQHRWIGVNTGSFLIRNCQWSLDLLDAWAPFGPEGETRINAGKMLTAKLFERPAFEADDQSALVYLLIFGDLKWRAKTHLEWEFFLHGYWKFVVYTYENLMARSHPGFGDDRWPFVTHFVGCKPCSPIVNAEVKECFTQMERAFNFADNQVLDKYGYAHRALASSKTQRIRPDTADPLGYIEEFRQKPVDDQVELTPDERMFLRNKEIVEAAEERKRQREAPKQP